MEDQTSLLDYDREDVLYILDLHCWLHRFYATVGGHAAHAFIEFVGKIIRNNRPGHFAVCTDLPHPTFRHDLAPGVYKAGRAKHEPDPTLLERLRWSRELVQDVFGLKLYARKGYEADDLMATLAKHAVADGLKVVLIALDKDMMQLVDDENVIMFDPMKSRVVLKEHVQAKFGVRADQLRDYLAIVGDTSDSVPGIHGAGPSAALAILGEFQSLDYALQHARSAHGHPFWTRFPRYRTMLRDQYKEALLSQQLVTLACDAPITYDRTELRLVP